MALDKLNKSRDEKEDMQHNENGKIIHELIAKVEEHLEKTNEHITKVSEFGNREDNISDIKFKFVEIKGKPSLEVTFNDPKGKAMKGRIVLDV